MQDFLDFRKDIKVSDLLLKYKTDKNFGVIEPKNGHYYGESYNQIFSLFDRNAYLNILEIGVQKGGSLKAWKDYFPNSNIYGVDIKDEVLPEYRDNSFTYIFKDIKDPKVKEQLKNVMFNLIIDDGSHYIQDVLYSVFNYAPKLVTGGIMVIEDCQNPEFLFQVISCMLAVEYSVTYQDLRKVNGHYDDFLIVIQRLYV